MSKSITIPSNRGSRITVKINETEYVYAAGATVTVPDEVAAQIADMIANDPGGTRETATDELLAGVAKDIDDLKDAVGDLEDAVDDLDDRVTALEGDDTPAADDT